MIVLCQDWLFSIQKVAYLLSISIMMIYLKSLDLPTLIRLMVMIASLRMIKICDKAIVKPLSIIYKNCIDIGIFPDLWKKSNIVPVHKKVNKQLLQKLQTSFFDTHFMEKFLRKFCTIQYLHIYKKTTCFVIISLVFDHMLHVNQLLSIVHKIYASF